ncbi:ee7b439f-c28e-4634-b66d-d90efb748d89 [Sclerotinia trifoliorum]|uniref:Ee7b439f-c28e-4634-b66d-d90efb748d89 n=1 Tax=Sclerotinia trifoliorum TaxID=28548 RepID=A0A8H2VTL8_9HELO|nr:ee7b439f-c28e-4634-b66d-d90efb748d89 [Sclerotinia trifoliorum]
MSLETAEEFIEMSERTLPHHGGWDDDPGSYPAPLPSPSIGSFGDEFNNVFDDLTTLTNDDYQGYDYHLGHTSDLLDHRIDVRQCGGELDALGDVTGDSSTQAPSQTTGRILNDTQPTEMPAITQINDASVYFSDQMEGNFEVPHLPEAPIDSQISQILSGSSTTSVSGPHAHRRETSEFNVLGSIENPRPMLRPRASTRNKESSSFQGQNQIQNVRGTALDGRDLVSDQADHYASHDPSIPVHDISTNMNIQSELFDIVCEGMHGFEDKNLDQRLVASKIKDIIQAFYRRVAAGDETQELEILILDSILEFIRHDAVPWRDMKPTKISEAVYKIYFDAGWTFNPSREDPPRGQSTTPALSSSSQQTHQTSSVYSHQSKRRSNYEDSMSTASLFSKRLKSSPEEYHCYYDDCNARVEPKEIGRHNTIHNPYEFTACIVPGCDKIFVRKDAMRNHLDSKFHKRYIESLSIEEKSRLPRLIKRNTFVINDRTHEYCVFCEKELLRGSWENCHMSQAHIISHLRTSKASKTPLVFRHRCSNRDQCGKKEYWRSSPCVQPENRERVPRSDDDDTDSETHQEIDGRNDDYTEDGESIDRGESADSYHHSQKSSDYDFAESNKSFTRRNYPTNRHPSSYKSPYRSRTHSTSLLSGRLETSLEPESDLSMTRYLGANSDLEHFNNQNLQDTSDRLSRCGVLVNSVNSLAAIAEPGAKEDGSPSIR